MVSPIEQWRFGKLGWCRPPERRGGSRVAADRRRKATGSL